jgi:stage II sporulation protein M
MISTVANSQVSSRLSYKSWIIIAASLFTIGIATGFFIPTDSNRLLSQELAALQQLGAILGPFKITTAIFIFLKNVLAITISFIFSPLLCLFPVTALSINGALISVVAELVLQQKSVGFLLAGLVPHGIFELPALIIGEAASLSFGTMIILAAFKKDLRERIPANFKQNIKLLILAFVLLVPAAIIETYVTPLLLLP